VDREWGDPDLNDGKEGYNDRTGFRCKASVVS
jgi:hypothetical protein